jgi:hypothetical protein
MALEATTQRRILQHSVLSALALLIPVPFVDDMVVDYFRRRLVRRLGEERGMAIPEEDVRTLADDESKGCLPGCLGAVVLYPIKKIFRQIFFFLEWKRATDIVSTVYHRGVLLDWAMEQGRLGPKSAAEVRAAIDAVLAETPVGPVEMAVRGVFNQSKSVLKGGVAILQRAVGGREKQPEQVAGAVEAVKAEEDRQISGVVDLLQQQIATVPDEHFTRMRERLSARLTTGAGNRER